MTGQTVTGPEEMTNIEMRAVNEDELAAYFREIENSPRLRPSTIDDPEVLDEVLTLACRAHTRSTRASRPNSWRS